MDVSPASGAENRKSFFKHWTGVLVLVILAGLVIWGLLNLPQILNAVQGKYTAWKTQRQIAALEKPYKTDKIGGRTPEETFDMFISALKKGDVDLASKYFVLKKQDEWEKTLREYQKGNILENFLKELEDQRKKWERSKKDISNSIEFYYTTTIEENSQVEFNGQKLDIPAGEYTNTTRFEKYPTGVWKIDLL